MSPMDVKVQKMSCTSESLLIAPHPRKDIGRMIAGYPWGRMGTIGSSAYSLTQRTTHMNVRRAVVCQVTIWLTRQGTHQAMDYNRRTVVLKEVCEFSEGKNPYTHWNLSLDFIYGHLTWPSKSRFLKTASAAGLTVLVLQLGHCRSYAKRQLTTP